MTYNTPFFKDILKYGDLYIDKVLLEDYYIILSILRNNNNDFFICLCCDVREEQRWIINKIDALDLAKFLKDEIDANSIFYLGNYNKIVITRNYIDKKIVSVEKNANELDYDDIPEKGTFLELEMDDDLLYYIEKLKDTSNNNISIKEIIKKLSNDRNADISKYSPKKITDILLDLEKKISDNYKKIKDELLCEMHFSELFGRIMYDASKRRSHYFDFYSITAKYKNSLKEKILSVSNKVDQSNFYSFKEKYKLDNITESDVISKANFIKNDNSDIIANIGNFLFDNGIILLIEDKPSDDFKYLDGFTCFLGKYPVIIVYELDKKNERRMLFTIAHEIYHLLCDENEKLADKFAGAMLLTPEDIDKELNKNGINKNDINKNIKDNYNLELLFEKLHTSNLVSMTSMIKTLIDNNYIEGKESDYYYLKKNLKYKLNKIQSLQVNIKSTEDILKSKLSL